MDRFGQPNGGAIAIDARLTQQELADMIGTSRETLATTIGSLRERGVVEMGNQRVVVLDADRLRAIAET
jgi:CRP/FNR family transcriptional regulator